MQQCSHQGVLKTLCFARQLAAEMRMEAGVCVREREMLRATATTSPVAQGWTGPRMDQTWWSGSRRRCTSWSFSAVPQTGLEEETTRSTPHLHTAMFDSPPAHADHLPTTLLSSLSKYMFHIRLAFSSSLGVTAWECKRVRGTITRSNAYLFLFCKITTS